MSELKDTILVVDDNPTNLRVLVDYLQQEGYKTLVATSGERAIAQMERHRPDLVLLDVMMPGIDGFETCRRLKANPATADVPVIFMTALNDVEHKVEGFRIGAVDYVTKPFWQEEVSARIKLHLTIERQKAELQHLNATKDKFFSVIGHDLRSPFTALLGFSELFADPGTDISREDQLRFGALLYESARTAFNLLENLLEWARIQRGSLVCEPHVMDLHSSVEETLSLLTHSAAIKGISILHTVPERTYVMADGNMLPTVLRNLTSNAIKFTGKGGSVQIASQQCDGLIRVSVSDTGMGMSEDDQRRVLSSDQPLSSKGTGGESGTGLGLLLCRDFVARQGGELWVESAVGHGATFFFTLPLAAQQ